MIDPELSEFLNQVNWKCEHGIFVGVINDTPQTSHLFGAKQSGDIHYETVNINYSLDCTLHWYRSEGIITFRAINITGEFLN